MSKASPVGPILAALTVLALLTAAFFLTYVSQEDSNDAVMDTIYDASYLDGILLREVVNLRENNSNNFDALVTASRELKRALDTLEAQLTQGGYAAYVQAEWERLRKDLGERDENIERFKSTSALYRNSIVRMPDVIFAINLLEDWPGMDSESQHAMRDLHRLAVQQAVAPSDEVNVAVTQALEESHALASSANPRILAAYTIITRHLPMLMRTRQSMSQIVPRILDHNVAEALKRVRVSFDARYEQNLKRANFVRWVLFILCVLLIPYCARVVHAQRRLNLDLDKKVGERTNALLKLNTKLRSEILEREQAQRLVEDAHQQLIHSSKMAALGEMAGGVAHEINNPLAIISMRIVHVTRALRAEPVNVAQALQFCKVIAETVDRIAKIVAGLRTFSRSAEDDPLSAKSVAELVAESVALCTERMRGQDIELIVAEIAPSLMLSCRPVQISQVLVNLLNNAHDALRTFEGARWVRVEAQAREGQLELSVTNVGPKIAEALRAKIFQPFFTTKQVGSGTGLGLSISLGIARNHGGALTLDDDCEHTRFVLRIPLTAAASETLEAA